MTLKELKDKKIFSPDIKDNELIRICNEVLKPSKEIKSVDFQLADEFVSRIKYSKQMIDFMVSKILNNKDLSTTRKYEHCIKYLKDASVFTSKNGALSEEAKYISQVLEKVNKEKIYYETMDSIRDKNKDVFMNIAPNDLTKLNKEALAAMMGVILGNQSNTMDMMNALLEQVKQLNAKVDSLTSNKNKEVSAPLEAPPKPNFIPETTPKKVVQNAPNGPVVSRGSNGMPTLFPMGSLHDLITRNILPKMDEKQLLDYCNNVLGFNAKDMKFVPSVTQLDRLKDSAFISSSRIKSDISAQHKGVSGKYTELISSYERMLNDIKGKPGFEKDVASLEQLIDKITKKRDEYSSVISGFEADNMEQYFQFGASRFQDKMGEITSEQQRELGEIDESLKELMDRKKSLEKADYKHFFSKMKNKRDLKKVVSRINKLKTKQGRIKSSQKRIVDIYTSKYVKKMEREFNKFVREQERISVDFQRKQNQLVDLNEKQKKMERLSRKMVSNEEKRAKANKIGQVSLDGQNKVLESRQKMLQSRIDSLKGKVGSVELSKQYSTTFTREYAYAL